MEKTPMGEETTCPSFATIAGVIDNELPREAKERIEEHIIDCPRCLALYRGLVTAENLLKARLVDDYATPDEGEVDEETTECIDDEVLALYLGGEAKGHTAEAIERHLASCNRCLRRAMSHARISGMMAKGVWPAMPDHIEGRYITALVNVKRPADAETWEKVVYDLSRAATAIHKTGDRDYGLVIQLAPVDTRTAAIAFTLKEHLAGAPGVEISLINRKTMRKFASQKTGAGGALTFGKVPTGTYNLHVGESDIKVEINIIEEPLVEEEEER